MNYVDLAKQALVEHRRSTELEANTTVTTNTTKPLDEVLKGLAVELWSDALGERFWLVANEADARLLAEPRGSIYTAEEARRVVTIGDPKTVAFVHKWKREFSGIVRETAE